MVCNFFLAKLLLLIRTGRENIGTGIARFFIPWERKISVLTYWLKREWIQLIISLSFINRRRSCISYCWLTLVVSPSLSCRGCCFLLLLFSASVFFLFSFSSCNRKKRTGREKTMTTTARVGVVMLMLHKCPCSISCFCLAIMQIPVWFAFYCNFLLICFE